MPHAAPTRTALALALLLALLPPAAARAQSAPGVGDDAIVLPRGVLRTTLLGRWTYASESFGSDAAGAPTSERVPLTFGLATLLDEARAGALGGAETALRSLTGRDDLTLSLGVRAAGDVVVSEAPIELALGLGARLQVSALLKYVETRTVIGVRSAPATIGANPALRDDAAGAAAAQRNAAVVDGLRQAASQLQALVAACAADPASSPACGTVNADPQGAQGVATAASSAAADLESIYGTASVTGPQGVPMAGSPAQQAVVERLAALRAELERFGVTGMAADAPAAAVAPFTLGELSALTGGVLDPENASPVVTQRYGLGDVELGAKLLLLDTFGGGLRAVNARGVGLRLALGGMVRLPTGEEEDPALLADVGVGGGHLAIEGRVATDLVLGPRAWISAVGRYGVQRPADEELLTADDPSSLATVRRDPGDYLELEVTPRWSPSRYVSVAAHYQYRRVEATTYAATSGSAVDPALLEALASGTEGHAHRVGVGVVLSTVPAYADGRIDWPADVSYLYRRTVSGGGLGTWDDSRHEIGLRVYLRMWGRSPREKPSARTP